MFSRDSLHGGGGCLQAAFQAGGGGISTVETMLPDLLCQLYALASKQA